LYVSDTYTYSTASPVIPVDLSAPMRSVDVPVANFAFKYYEAIVLYYSKNYMGSKNNIVYKYTNYNGAAHDWDNKRDTTTIVWIYPSAEAMYDSGTEIGAYIAQYVPYQQLEVNTTWTLNVEELRLKDDANFILTLRVCEPNAFNCIYGSESEIVTSKDWGLTITLAVFIPLFIILLIVLCIVCWKCDCLKRRKRSMDREEVVRGKDDVPMEGYANYGHEDSLSA